VQSSIQDILKDRLEAYQNNTLVEQFKVDKKEYRQKWLNAVSFFFNKINQERSQQCLKNYSFIVILKKVEHIKEIDDLRWFYKQCLNYEKKKKGNTFSKCFFGSLKIRK
jgi:hypothetical protein